MYLSTMNLLLLNTFPNVIRVDVIYSIYRQTGLV